MSEQNSIIAYGCPLCGREPKVKIKTIFKDKKNPKRNIYKIKIYCKKKECRKNIIISLFSQSEVKGIGSALYVWNEFCDNIKEKKKV